MGSALPAAIAAALHEPARPAIAFTGDGGLAMCLGELATAVDANAKVIVVVFNDAGLSLMALKAGRGMPRRGAAPISRWRCRAWADWDSPRAPRANARRRSTARSPPTGPR